MAPSKAVLPAATPCVTVVRNALGDWIARERRGAIGHAFATQQEAIHFAVFALGNGRAVALLVPTRDAGNAA